MNRDKMFLQKRIWIFMCAIVLLIPLTYAEDFLESQKKHADEVISLDEHLRSLDEPVESYRSVSKRSNCDTVCGSPPLRSKSELEANCTQRKWVPNYVEKSGCECLKEYRCCDAQCPVADLTSCWKNGTKGQQFGIMEIDCCGCNVIKCVLCEPTLPRSKVCPKTGKLSKCYNYSNTETHANITGCFRATCEEKPSDAPADESCDPKCQNTTVKTTQCLFDYNICEATKVMSNCPLYLTKENIKLLKKPFKCYHNTPTKVDDANGGYFEESSSRLCKKCFKWNYSSKSCAAKNSAAKLLSCHKHGAFQMDKKCFQKNVSPDDCGCNVAQCLESSAPESDTFGKDDVCPLNHLKISGTSICMKARDICKQCVPLTELTPPSCTYGQVIQTKDSIGCLQYECKLPTIPEAPCALAEYKLVKYANQLKCKQCPGLSRPSCQYGSVVETKDSSGCPKYECKLPTIPEVPCPSDTYKLNKNTNQLTCHKGRKGSEACTTFKYYGDKKVSRNDAQAKCQEWGGKMASLNTIVNRKWAILMIPDNTRVWVGAECINCARVDDDKWTWPTGDHLWLRDPMWCLWGNKRTPYDGRIQDGIYVQVFTGTLADGVGGRNWCFNNNSKSPNNKAYFICEKDG